MLAVSGSRSQQNTHDGQGKSLVVKTGLLGLPGALPSYSLLQPLVWSDWVTLFSLKGFFHASLGTR